ncbi:MAG: glycine cleavage system protein H, partial [Pseudomonadota bacterium]
MSEEYPSDLLYTREHEWARIDGKVATVGVTKFAVEQLGDITQVDLPKEGESVRKDDVFGSIE